MFVNITDTEVSDNKGSSAALVTYLEKENSDKSFDEREFFFNHESDKILASEAIRRIDSNIAKLGANEDKFFLVNISPSEDEIKFLRELYGSEIAALKAYTLSVMDIYAKNFNRTGIEGKENLLYFAKLEKNRYYTHEDQEVISGQVKRGDPRPGLNTHVQVIVSRKDITNKIKLSARNNSSGRNKEHSKKFGEFSHINFKVNSEKAFDEMFSYERRAEHSVQYHLKMGDFIKDTSMGFVATVGAAMAEHHLRNDDDKMAQKKAEKKKKQIQEQVYGKE